MAEKQKIDDRVDEKIDEKISDAKFQPNGMSLPGPLDTAENVASKTTIEEDLKTLGQRRVNLVWELTQAIIALSITTATIYATISGTESLLLGNAFTLIVALYFVRTNHTKTGGVGGTDSAR